MNWRAVGIGAAVGVGGTLVLGVLFRLFPWEVGDRLWLFLALGYLTGGIVDIATGATAGALARRRGALHGLVAGTIATLLSPLIGYALFWVQTRGAAPLGLLDFFAGVAVSGVLGIALSTAAGAIAARVSVRTDARRDGTANSGMP